jgi:hypothetical protein
LTLRRNLGLPTRAIDMCGMPREEVIALLEESGATVLEVEEDTGAGSGWTSFRYCATTR